MMASRQSCLLLGAFFCLLLAGGGTDRVNTNWIKPGSFDRWRQMQRINDKTEGSCDSPVERDSLPCDCPPSPPAVGDVPDEQRLALVFYRKLVKTLFARDELRQDESVKSTYFSDLSLKITSRQLDKLMNEDQEPTLREIDNIVTEILEQSTNARRKAVLLESRCERLYDFLMGFFESKLVHSLLPVVLLITGCFIIRAISRITRMHPFVVFLLLILSITVCNKWKECNENLAKKSLQHMDDQPAPSAWSRVFGGRSGHDGTPLAICDPLQVLVESTVSMQAVYLKAILSEFLNAYTEYTKNVWFVEKIVVGLLMLGVAYLLISTIVTVGIQSGLQTVGNMVTSGFRTSARPTISQAPTNGEQAPPAINLNIHIGENGARLLSRADLLALENQRIEVVPEIENDPPVEASQNKEVAKDPERSVNAQAIEEDKSSMPAAENEPAEDSK